VDAVIHNTPSSDVDHVAKALIFITEAHKRSVDMIKHYVTPEVANSESVTTLFRSNSLVTKMTTHCNKVIGLKYLWHALALGIHELNDIGAGDSDNSKYDTRSQPMMSFMAHSSIDVSVLKSY
jgi:hypothetical protein